VRPAALAAALLLSTSALADVHKCVIAGKTTYQSAPCSGTADTVIATPKTGAERADDKGRLPVTEGVARECYEGYRRLSLDPTDAKMLSYVATMAPAGFPVLYVNAVFRNRNGGPSREVLWCRLTPDLTIDAQATDKAQDEWFRRLTR
jgi:hypothetical protein